MKATIIGIRRAENKDGNIATSLFVSLPFEDWESAGDTTICLGRKVSSEYLRKDINAAPGDIVELSYKKGFKDQAVLDEVTVVERAKDKTPATK